MNERKKQRCKPRDHHLPLHFTSHTLKSLFVCCRRRVNEMSIPFLNKHKHKYQNLTYLKLIPITPKQEAIKHLPTLANHKNLEQNPSANSVANHLFPPPPQPSQEAKNIVEKKKTVWKNGRRKCYSHPQDICTEGRPEGREYDWTFHR